MNYRKDVRSDDQFKRDIKAGSIAERRIIERWLNVVEKETGRRPSFNDNGCDNSGSYLEEDQVTQAADYVVEGYGLVEVKFSNPKLHHSFHLKVDQVERILKDKSKILFVNGWSTKRNAEFVLITPDELLAATRSAPQVVWRGFGGKLSFKISVNKFHWQSLP